MRYQWIAVLALAGAVACKGANSDAAKADSLQRDLAMAPADSAAAVNDRATANAPNPTTVITVPTPPRRTTSAPLMLSAGTEFGAEAMDSITSRHNRAGESMRIRVASDVKDAQGRTVIPAGSIVALRIDQLAPAENDADHTGKLKLTPTTIEVNGQSYPLNATVDSVKYSIVGRGVTAGDAAKVGAGAVVGGIAGRVIGGKRGTAVGAVVGAAGGAAVASQTNDRDVVIRAGNYVRIRLEQAFSRF